MYDAIFETLVVLNGKCQDVPEKSENILLDGKGYLTINVHRFEGLRLLEVSLCLSGWLLKHFRFYVRLIIVIWGDELVGFLHHKT